MGIEKRIKREEKIFLHPVADNTFEISNQQGEILVGADEDYFIYFKNVTFNEFGVIDGRYLGENPNAIIDSHCVEVSYSIEQNTWLGQNGKSYKTARMVAVNNKTKTIIVIQSQK